MRKWPLYLSLFLIAAILMLGPSGPTRAEEPQKPPYSLDEMLQAVDDVKALMPAEVQARGVSATPEPLGTLWSYAGPLQFKTIWGHAEAQVDQTSAKNIPYRLKLIEAVMEADIMAIVKAQQKHELAFTITYADTGKGFYSLAPGMFDPDSFEEEPFRSVRNWEEVQQNLKDFYDFIRFSWSDPTATQRVFDPPKKANSFGWRYANFLGLLGPALPGGGHVFPPAGTPSIVVSPSTTTTVTGTPVAGTGTPGATATLTPMPVSTIPASCQAAAPDCRAYIQSLQLELAKQRSRAIKNLVVFWWVAPSLALFAWGAIQFSEETGDKTRGIVKVLLSVISLVIACLWYFNIINISKILR